MVITRNRCGKDRFKALRGHADVMAWDQHYETAIVRAE